MTTYTYFTADLITGKVMANLPLRAVSIDEPALNEPSTLSASLDLLGLGLPIDDIKVATATARTALYVDVDGQLLWGGIIWKRRLSGDVLELSASDFLSYYARRRITVSRLFTEGVDDQFEIVRTLMRDAATGSAGGDIGVNLGAGLSGRTRAGVYLRTDLIPVLQAVQELAAGLDGFDFTITVSYDNNGLATKNLQLGYPQLGRPKETTELLIEYPGSVSQWQWPEEGDRMISTAFVRGPADGDTVPIAERTDSGLLSLGYPRLEDEFPPPANAILIQQFEAEAAVKLAAFRNPVVLPTFTIPVGIDDPHPGTYRIGDQFRVRISDPQWMPAYPDGRAGFDDYMRLVGRSIQVAPGGGQSVSLTMSTFSGILSGGLPVSGDVPPVVPPGPAIFAPPTISVSKLLPTGAPLIGDDVTVQLIPTVDPALRITAVTLTMDQVPVPLIPALPSAGPFTFTYPAAAEGAPPNTPPTVTVTRVLTTGGGVGPTTLFTELFEQGPVGADLAGGTAFTSWGPVTGSAKFATTTAPGGGGVVDTALFTENFDGGSNGVAISTAPGTTNTVFDGYSSTAGTATFTADTPFSGGLAGRYSATGGVAAAGTATFSENFETGTNGVAITAGNSFFDGFLTVTGAVKFNNTSAAVGSLFARFDNPGGNDAISMYKTLGSTKTTQAVSFYLRFPSLPQSSINICNARSGGNPPTTAGTFLEASLRLEPGGTLVLRDGASIVGTSSSTVLAPNTWYRVEWKLVAGSPGTQELKIFTTPTATVATETLTGTARTFTAANFDNFAFGLTNTTTTPTVWHLDIDGIQIGDVYPGPWPGGGAVEQAVSTYKTLSPARTAAALGMFVRIASYPTATTAIATARGPADAARGQIRINTAGKLEIRNPTTVVGTSAASVPLGRWFRVDWQVDSTTGVQEARLFTAVNNINGTTPNEVVTGAATYPTGAAGTVEDYVIGIINSLPIWYIDFDVVRIAATFPGPYTPAVEGPVVGSMFGRYTTAAAGTGTALFTENFDTGGNGAALSTGNTIFDGYDTSTGTATFTNATPFGGAYAARYASTGAGGAGSTAAFSEDFAGITGTVSGNAITTSNSFITGFGSGTGTVKFNGTTPAVGSLFARFSNVSGGDAISVHRILGSTKTTQAVSFYIRFPSAPTDDINICNARRGGSPPTTGGATVAASIRLQTNRKLILRNGSSNNGVASTTTLAADTWYRLEWKLVGGSPGTQELKIFADITSTTVTETMTARVLSVTDVDNFLFGLTNAPTPTGVWNLDIDGIQIGDDYPGPWPAAGGGEQAVATYKTLSTVRDTVALGMFVRIAALPPAVTAIATARGPADALRAALRINTAGKLEIRNVNSLVDTSLATLPFNQWFRVDWQVDSVTGTQEARLFITDNNAVSPDEVLTGTYPAAAAGTIDNYAVGIINSLATWHVDIDTLRVAATYPGPTGSAPQAIGSLVALGSTMLTVATSFFGRFPTATLPAVAFPCVAKLGAGTAGAILINTDRSVSIRNGVTLTGSTTAAGVLPVDDWWRMDWKVSSATGSQELRIFVGGNRSGTVPDATLTGVFDTSVVDGFNYGITTAMDAWQLDLDAVTIATDFAGSTAPSLPNPTPFIGDPVTVRVAATVAPGRVVSSLVLRRDGAPVTLTADGNYIYTA